VKEEITNALAAASSINPNYLIVRDRRSPIA
jgi:hypothetical protein